MNKFIEILLRFYSLGDFYQGVLPKGELAVLHNDTYFVDYDLIKIKDFEIIGRRWSPPVYAIKNMVLYRKKCFDEIAIYDINDLDTVFKYEFRLRTNNSNVFHQVFGYDLRKQSFSILINEKESTMFGLKFDSNNHYDGGKELEVKDLNVTDLWVERFPIGNAPFKSSKVTYYKMYGQWLDEPLDE